MIFSSPSNAPPQMNRMSLVLTWMYSCCGCLRPPCGGTEATVPSRILRSACCTPSPETSRVMLGEQRLAHAGRSDEHDVALVELDVALPARVGIDALVVVVDRHGQRLLRLLLAA